LEIDTRGQALALQAPTTRSALLKLGGESQ
jgi:hypothetical protein